ncbi:hypothetical protein HBI63_135820 [Parastagonospora nodorum]|nr:hypothetical protein HBI54_237050 [Parastagonospora nodorum]KAH6149786.1 hypothetical protein HBI63_135820 [Parastagonospora nodorum]KAH6392909.1 hypothetical protein HBI60_149620 [Parastagonospora nodorum]
MLLIVTDSTTVETEDRASELKDEACYVLETMLLVIKADVNVVVRLNVEEIEEDEDDSAVFVCLAKEEEKDAALHLLNPA